MSKQKNEKLKLILLILLVVSIPLVFISLELINNLQIVSGINPSQMVTDTLTDAYRSFQIQPKNNDPSTIRKILTEIFNHMNEKNYTKLYSLLTDDIKEHLFPTEEQFITYMEAYLNGKTYSPKFSNYQKLNKEKNDTYIVNVSFIPYSTTEFDINVSTSSTANMSDTFTIYIQDDNTYKFSFLSYIGVGKPKYKYENDAIYTKIAATHLYLNKTIFNIEVTNKTDSDIFIKEKDIYVKTGVMPQYYPNFTLIPANSTVTISHTVYTGFNLKDALPTRVYFSGVYVGESVYLFSLPVSYPVKISAYD